MLWQRLRLVIVYSTEIFLPLNVNQSPFNVGLLIELPAFTPEQVQDLAVRYGIATPEPYVAEMMVLVGGNPYLTQLSLFYLSQNPSDLADFVDTAIAPDRVFESHLRQQLLYLEQHPDLKAAMQQVVSSASGVELYPIHAFQLQGAGLVRFQQQRAIASCELYQRYFAQVLKP